MKGNIQKDNKGFSLVELIVVIAIMGILAVTLAPRLSQYVEKARKASDQEAVNTIFTAAKLANVEFPLGPTESFELAGAPSTTTNLYAISDNGEDWTLNSTYTDPDDTDSVSQKFYNAMIETLSNFKLKSKEVQPYDTTGTKVVTQIKIATDSNGFLSVTLDYDGDGTVDNDIDYVVKE